MTRKAALRAFIELDRLIEYYYQTRKKGYYGIAVETDYYARKYQAITMRHEILKAFLEERPPNWYVAPYLSKDEARRRNLSYGTEAVK